jgi:hypothetical protein
MRLPSLCLSLLLLAPAVVNPPKDGVELIRQMHDRYDGKWYRTVTFVQKTSYPDGRTETWYEAAAVPGRLRIDVAPVDSGNTIIFRSDSVYQFQRGERRAAQPMVHPLMVLGFDVYAQPPEATIRKLQDLGFDLGKIRADSWKGRRAWVVGSVDADTLAREFWVDQENLLFVRMVQLAPRGGAEPGKRTVGEIHFNRYQPLGGGWIAAEVAFFNNGEKVQMEEYRDIVADPALPEGLFDPAAWRRPGWVGTGP